jgi:hypothetical protein
MAPEATQEALEIITSAVDKFLATENYEASSLWGVLDRWAARRWSAARAVLAALAPAGGKGASPAATVLRTPSHTDPAEGGGGHQGGAGPAAGANVALCCWRGAPRRSLNSQGNAVVRRQQASTYANPREPLHSAGLRVRGRVPMPGLPARLLRREAVDRGVAMLSRRQRR